MFEPSLDYFDRFYKNVQNLENCQWIKKGLWSETTTISFFERPDSDISSEKNLSGIQSDHVYDCGKWIKVPVVSLDEALKNKRVTFIKMDIEGSECEAIKGARNIIASCKPKLAICVYHKKGDLIRIPDTILDINSEYQFYMRHKGMGILDTVLYGV